MRIQFRLTSEVSTVASASVAAQNSRQLSTLQASATDPRRIVTPALHHPQLLALLSILDKTPVYREDFMETDEREWVTRCSARLHAQWPRIGREQRDELAQELWADAHWRGIEPEQAAAEWLRQGMPNAA